MSCFTDARGPGDDDIRSKPRHVCNLEGSRRKPRPSRILNSNGMHMLMMG